MIKLEISGCCTFCPRINLELKEASYYFDAFDARKFYKLRCIHENVCGQLQRELAADVVAQSEET